MHKIKPLHKIMALVLSMAVVFGTFFALGIASNAASYSSIVLNVPRVSQRPDTGDCAIASIASVEAYFNNLPSGDYTSEAYRTVYATNGYSVSAKWDALGYEKINSFSMKTLYEQLSSGFPVIVHRTSSHYSVVYGYNGSKSTLELSGFLIFDVDDSYSNSSSKTNLEAWKRSYTLDQMVVRRDGFAVPTTDLTINSNHPEMYHVKGDTFAIYGSVSSRYKITNVTMTIKDSTGAIAQNSTYTSNPGTTTFRLSNGDSNMNFSKLSVGSYKYSVTAKDASGATESYSYSFKVVNGEADIPTDDIIEDGIKYVSYKAIITADPSLNLRTGAGMDYSVLLSIPYGETVSISAEYKGWAKTTYGGKTGWVSMTYIDELIGSNFYVRVNESTSLRSSALSSASSVATVQKNAIIKVSSETNGWFSVSYNGKTGWLSSASCIKGVGDLNGIGCIDSTDALVMLQAALGQTKLTTTQEQIGDLNGDTKVNSTDALIALQIATGSYQ